MSEEDQIAELEAQIKRRDAQRAYSEKRARRRAYWLGEVAPVMVLFLLVALFLMLNQCSIIRITG